MEELLAIVIITIVFSPALAIGYAIGAVRTRRKITSNEPAVALEAVRLDGVVEDIKHHAYEHMALGDGALAPIVVDIIRESEKDRDKSLILASKTAGGPQQRQPFIQLTSSPAPQGQPRYPAPQRAQSAPVPPVAPPVTPPAPQPSTQHYPFQ